MTTVHQLAIDEAAHRLAEAARTRTPCAPIRDVIGPGDVDSAYRVQSLNVAGLIASGRRVVGRKIGITSPAVQRQLGVDQPDFGVLLDDMDCSGDDLVDSARLLQPRIEAEIAFVLARDVTETVTAETAPGYVSDVVVAFEVVDSRVANWDISLADTIADNASSGSYVLGDRLDRRHVPDLRKVQMTMTMNGATVSTGAGSDCLGSPWNALAWLANTSLEHGSGLRSGEVILSGALGPMVAVTPGSTYAATVSGLGCVTATFGAESTIEDVTA